MKKESSMQRQTDACDRKRMCAASATCDTFFHAFQRTSPNNKRIITNLKRFRCNAILACNKFLLSTDSFFEPQFFSVNTQEHMHFFFKTIAASQKSSTVLGILNSN